MYIRIKGIFVQSRIIQTKKGGQLQINTILDETGGNVTLLGDQVRVDPKTPVMLPVTIEANVSVSNYNGTSFILETFHAEPQKA